MSIECTHCERFIKNYVSDYSDWLYNNNLYSADKDIEVKCPICDYDFWIRPYQMTDYEVAKAKEDL